MDTFVSIQMYPCLVVILANTPKRNRCPFIGGGGGVGIEGGGIHLINENCGRSVQAIQIFIIT